MSAALRRRYDAALGLAEEAGALALRMRPAPGTGLGAHSFKGAQDWLTEADGAVERFLRGRLAALFPDDAFLGEEEGGTASGAGGIAWVVDPIDGTSNYARGGARWAVSIGLVEGAAAHAGIVRAPALGDTYAALAGGGARLNGASIRAAPTDQIGRAIVEVGWSPRRPNARHQALYAGLQEAGAMLRNGGSAAVGLAEVAAGRTDGYLELHVNAWDVAGSLAILREAGAACSSFLPGGLRAGAPIVAAGPGVADALRMVFREAGGELPEEQDAVGAATPGLA